MIGFSINHLLRRLWVTWRHFHFLNYLRIDLWRHFYKTLIASNKNIIYITTVQYFVFGDSGFDRVFDKSTPSMALTNIVIFLLRKLVYRRICDVINEKWRQNCKSLSIGRRVTTGLFSVECWHDGAWSRPLSFSFICYGYPFVWRHNSPISGLTKVVRFWSGSIGQKFILHFTFPFSFYVVEFSLMDALYYSLLY